MDTATLLGSAVVSAIVTAIVAWRSTERRIQIENITQERAKWREQIRTQSQLVHEAATRRNLRNIAEARLAFTLLVNPFDSQDQAILICIDRLKETEGLSSNLRQFADRVAYLLKHDWERAKAESKPWFFFRRTPRREMYP